MFVLQYVQLGLAGLMDGSVSTLAPVFAAAFATHGNWPTFLLGLAASIGAGISMGFAEVLSDDGSLTRRGSPWFRGRICGLMTTIRGLGILFPILCPIRFLLLFLSQPRSHQSSSSWNYGRLLGYEQNIWIRRFFMQHFRLLPVVFSFSSLGF